MLPWEDYHDIHALINTDAGHVAMPVARKLWEAYVDVSGKKMLLEEDNRYLRASLKTIREMDLSRQELDGVCDLALEGRRDALR